LSKQLDDLQSKKIGDLLGPQAGLANELDAQFKALKNKLASEKLPIPKDLEVQFQKIKAAILGANLDLTRTTTELSKIADLGKILNQDSAEWFNFDEDLAKAKEKTAEFGKQLDEIRLKLQLGAIDTRTPQGAEQKRVAEIEVDFIQTANRITEIGRQAGATQEEIANDIALAWKKALAEIGSTDPLAGLNLELQKINVQAGRVRQLFRYRRCADSRNRECHSKPDRQGLRRA
jgi:hypothetical protein